MIPKVISLSYQRAMSKGGALSCSLSQIQANFQASVPNSQEMGALMKN